MEANGLSRFVKSDKPLKNKGTKETKEKEEEGEAKYGLKAILKGGKKK
jgi:hypothetical protein